MDYQNFNDQDKQYPVERKRFLVTFLFGSIQMMTSILMNTLTPIASQLSIVYGYSPLVINLGGLLYILMHPIFTFPAAYVIDSKGVKAGIMVGSILGILGISSRLLVNSAGFWAVIFGQILAGIGRPFILNCQAKISANWFRASKRAGVTQLLTLIINISLIVGILIPGLIFKGYRAEEGNQESVQQGKDLTFKLMMIEAVLGFICFIPNMLFQKEKPAEPPSESGYLARDSFQVAIKSVFKQRDFMLLLMSFGLYFGVFNALSIVLSFLLEPWFGTNSVAVSIVGGAPVLSGILGVIVLGPLQRKSKKFKKWIVICMLGSTSAMVLFYPMLQTNSLAAAAIISAYNSFFLIPLVPMMLELGCELAHPIGEGTAVGLLFAVGNLFGFILGSILSVIVKGQSKSQSAWGLLFCLLVFGVGFALISLAKQNLKRVKAERESSQRRSRSSMSSDAPSSGGMDLAVVQPQITTPTTNQPAQYQPPGNNISL